MVQVAIDGEPYWDADTDTSGTYRIEFTDTVDPAGSIDRQDRKTSPGTAIGEVGPGEDRWDGSGQLTVIHTGSREGSRPQRFDVLVAGQFVATLSPGQILGPFSPESPGDAQPRQGDDGAQPDGPVVLPTAGDLVPPDEREVCTTFPLSVLNNIPGVSGVEDVTICVPTPEGVAFVVVRELLEQLQPFETIRDIVRAVFDDLPAPEITVDEGLFGETVENLDEIVADVVEETLPDLPQLADDVSEINDRLDSLAEDIGEDVGEDITGLREDVQTVVAFVEGLPDVEDIDVRQRAVTLLQDLRADVPGVGFLLDPVEFTRMVITEAIDQAVDDQALQELDDALEEVE